MIYKSLKLVTDQLNDYLRIHFRLSEDIVLMSPVKDAGNVFPNRVSITVVGLERETSAGISFQRKNISESTSSSSVPAWQVNLNVLISVVFQDKQYEESLRLFSAVVNFVQGNTVIRSGNENETFSLEVVNLTINELSNLWSICGENYYPSLLCKMRMILVNADNMESISSLVTAPERTTGVK